ncbi:MAG: hypothetical protein JST39_16780 [Bacteroidetes bacterium]|nr:hypothetical protein [Bacteroidota bacterium]
MQKTLAISAFLIFFFSQFGKVINFCYCSVAAYQQTSSFRCNECEKQLVKNTEAEQGKHPHGNALSPSSEELYHLDNHIPFSFTYTRPLIVYSPRYTVSLYNEYNGSIFQPPGRNA